MIISGATIHGNRIKAKWSAPQGISSFSPVPTSYLSHEFVYGLVYSVWLAGTVCATLSVNNAPQTE